MNRCLANNPDAYANYNKTVANQNYSFGIPKERLLVKMKPGVDVYTRDAVANGIK
jgi:hypothetical protein